jgi:adenylate cyclase
MVGSRDEICFEVHVLRWDQWELHGRYPAGQKDLAVKDGRSLEKVSSISAVRVIRAFDPKERLHQETILYESPGLSKIEKRRRRRKKGMTKGIAGEISESDKKSRRGIGKKSKSGIAARTTQAKSRQSSTGLGVFVKLVLITLFSLIFGGLAVGLASVWLDEASLGRDVHSNILFGIFLGTFLISAIIMALTFLSDEDLGTWSRRRPLDTTPAKADQPAASSAKRAPDQVPVPEETEAMAEAVAAQLAETLHGDTAETEEASEPAETGDAAEIEDVAETEETVEPIEPPETADAAAADEIDAPGTADDVAEIPEDDDAEAGYTKEQKSYMTSFLDGALGDVDRNQLGSFEKFGIDLFLAGACEALAQDSGLDLSGMPKMLRDIIQSLGFNKSQSDSFAERYQDYLVDDPRYMQMFAAGRTALNARLGGDPNTAKHLEQALAEWNTSKAKEPAVGLISVLFTDIAGSIDLTQDKGDDAAQQVVHAHNQIVRDALLQFNGKEIKHTGDGIMASFTITSNSVEAASTIQRRAAAHNHANPDLPLNLKIGINAGEPISEDDDLFGTTVQIAARIVAEAGPGQILVSEIVRGICAGKKLGFVNRGLHTLKGFRGELTLYEVVWQESPTTVAGGLVEPDDGPEDIAPESAPLEVESSSADSPSTGSVPADPPTADAEQIDAPSQDASQEVADTEKNAPPESGVAVDEAAPAADPAPEPPAQPAPKAATAPGSTEPGKTEQEEIEAPPAPEHPPAPPSPLPSDSPVAESAKTKPNGGDGGA